MMSGLTGKVSCSGSLFLTEENAKNLLSGLQYLQSVTTMEPQLIYWGYIIRRARQLAIGSRTAEELTFARMVCMTRTMDQESLRSLQAAWNQVPSNDRQSLVKWFTADGLTTKSLRMMFLPEYFSNSIANPVVGLRFALLNLLDLLDRVEEHMDEAQALAYTIYLADLAAIVTDVTGKQGLCECIKLLRIVRQGTHIYLVLTKECRQAVAKVAWKRVRDRSRGHADLDAHLEDHCWTNQLVVNECDI